MQEMQVQSLSQEDPLEEEMATHSSVLAWKIPWTEEPGGLQSMGSQGQKDWAHTEGRFNLYLLELSLIYQDENEVQKGEMACETLPQFTS